MAVTKHDEPYSHSIGAPGDAGYGAPLHYVWKKRPLPSGGAASYAFETLALPLTTPIGAGVANIGTQFRTHSPPMQLAGQAVVQQAIAYNGVDAGYFRSQPLTDTQAISGDGFVDPGAVAPGNFDIDATRAF